MTLIQNIFGVERTFTLQSNVLETGSPLGVKSTPEETRVPKRDLEEAYYKDPVVFNSINKVTQIIKASKLRFMPGNDSKEAGDAVQQTEGFLEKIGYTGREYGWSDILETMIKYPCIYGSQWTELIPNPAGTKIVDLDYIDPKEMDYAKNSNDRIGLDKNQNPVGYTQTLTDVFTGDFKSDPRPEGIKQDSNQIFFKPGRIAHFKLYTIGNGFYPLGLIEPIFYISKWERDVIEAFANASRHTGYPRLVANIGDQYHECTPDMLKKTMKQIANSNYQYAFTMPDYVKLTILEAKRPEKLKEHSAHLQDLEITGLGLAKAFATGAGEATNRATLARQEYIVKLTLKDIMNNIADTIKSKIFYKILCEPNEKNIKKIAAIPNPVWGEVALEELDSKAKRWVEYAAAGLLHADPGIESLIRKMEELPPIKSKGD